MNYTAPLLALLLLVSSSFPFLRLRQTIFQLGASCLPHLILLLLLAQFFCGFSPKRKLDSTGKKGIQLAGYSRDASLDSRVCWRVQQTFNWLAGRACVLPCPALPRLDWFFDLQYTWDMSLVEGAELDPTRPDSTPECFAYLLARVNKLSVRAVIVNYILVGGPSYASKSVN